MSSYSSHLSREIERMKHEMTATLPKEMASAANLMVHPAAGAMALSALGFGLASQAAGTWLGAMSAAAEVSQRFWQPVIDELNERAAAYDVAPVAESAPLTPRAYPSQGVEKVPAIRARKVAASTDETREAVEPVKAQAAPLAMVRPERPDDLKAIAGIGPKLEQVLNAQGIWTYAQIAAWTAPEIAWVEDLLGFAGRIGRDGWIAQAASLAHPDGGAR